MSFLGDPTISDLADLIRAVDYERGELERAGALALPGWGARDPQAAAAWHDDLAAAGHYFDDWRPSVVAQIASVPDQAQVIIPADKVVWDHTRDFVRGYIDLDRRFRQAGNAGPRYEKMPQPTREDFDLDAYKFSVWATSPGTWARGARALLDEVEGIGVALFVAWLLVKQSESRPARR